jgi:multidrug efflux pump subunit AcrA (membrane-fusion protein)
MNPLLLLFLTASFSASLVLWQQQAIDTLRAATTRLSAQLLQARNTFESEQAALASARARLKQLEVDLQLAKQERAALAAAEALSLPTPEQEGWWPQNRPYFYLAKAYLSKVRFEGRPVTVDAHSGNEAKSPFARGDYLWASYRPFSDAGLNPHLAVLLGMSDEEVTAVNGAYSALVRGLREVEAARIQRVEPPKPDDDDGCVIVARLPSLTAETQPLLESWEQTLTQSLGASRSEILREHATRYFDEDLDQFGAQPREFLRNGVNLWVRFAGQWAAHLGGIRGVTFNLDWNRSVNGQDWEYGHLFGPGAPCELK